MYLLSKYFKDVSREFDEFQVMTHVCKAALLVLVIYYSIKIEIHSSCEIEYFVDTHLCKLCVILRSHVLLVACPH